MYTVVIKHRAALMAKDAYDWYEEQRVGLGDEFLAELESCYAKILKSPTQYGFIEKEYRRIQLKRFPYIVIYEILEMELVVYAVFHTKRNPDSRIAD